MRGLSCSLGEMAIDIDVIVNGNDTWETVSHLVRVHLEDILAHLQAERHPQEPVLSHVGVESG